MEKFGGFEAKKTAVRETLPAGGYVGKIMEARIQEYNWGQALVLFLEITEGKYKDFFANDYRSQDREDKKWRGSFRLSVPADDGSEKDAWSKRRFNNAMWAVEASNPGYHWDWNESGLKGKSLGLLFREREWEYDGRTGWMTECCAVTSVNEIRENKFKMPAAKPLVKTGGQIFGPGASVFSASPAPEIEDFVF